MFLPPVAPLAYTPPARATELRAVSGTAAVQEVSRRNAAPELDADQQRLLDQMRTRDRELRQQQRAQVLFGSTWVRTLPSYTYERGPDGDFYAIDGVAALNLGGRGMLDPALGRSAADATAAQPNAAATTAHQALTPAAPRRHDENFAAAAAHFYLASANAAPRRPIVDLFS